MAGCNTGRLLLDVRMVLAVGSSNYLVVYNSGSSYYSHYSQNTLIPLLFGGILIVYY